MVTIGINEVLSGAHSSVAETCQCCLQKLPSKHTMLGQDCPGTGNRLVPDSDMLPIAERCGSHTVCWLGIALPGQTGMVQGQERKVRTVPMMTWPQAGQSSNISEHCSQVMK